MEIHIIKQTHVFSGYKPQTRSHILYVIICVQNYYDIMAIAQPTVSEGL